MERKQAVYYQAGEFAKRAGVTIRTLHYYDEQGLLTPAVRSDAGYRLYTGHDLVRLQQIATLRLIGFPLKHIKEIIEGRELTLASALEIQRALIVQKRAQLDEAIAAIERAQRALALDDSGQLDALRSVMESLTMQDNWDWVKEKYTPEQLERLEQRYDPAMQAQWSAQWAALIAEIKAAQTDDPASDRAQTLAARWHEMISAFTGGETDIEQSLGEVYKDKRAPMPFDGATGAFINRALTIYKKRSH